jgi:DNA modification methylase
MKPVELIVRALLNSSKAGAIVADLFGGSGSTLIGCERRGRGPVDGNGPALPDVICRRYQEYTGKKAMLDGDGRSFDAIPQERAVVTA